jgi:hypothetical protein
MPLSKLKFAPGINRDMTDYSNTGGWYDCDKVRFRNGLPEKFGGWQKFLTSTFMGTAREMLRWSSLNGTIYTAVGTNLKVYINGGSLGGFYDATPIRRTATLTNPFTTVSGSATVTVTDAGNGAQAGDYVTFSGASAVGGITISGEYIVVTVTSSSTYTITASSNASSSATGGGTVTAAYQVSVGLNSLVFGTGWGSGPWGGADSPLQTLSLGASPIATSTATNTSSPYLRTTITITTPSAHGLSAGDAVAITGATSVGGIDSKFLNGPDATLNPYRAFEVVSTPTTTTITVYAWTNATSSTTGGGSGITMKTYKNATNAGTSTGWGKSPDSSSFALQLRLWSFDNYGEDLIMNPRDGEIYYWIENTPSVRGVKLSSLPNASHVPGQASRIIVTEIGKHVMAFGATPFVAGSAAEDTGVQNKMLIRFSSDERPEYWDETDTAENAGSIPLSNGSFIVTAEQTRQEILCWTDSALYSIQYQGAPYIFTASMLSSGTDILGPNVVATAVNTTFWMGSDNFYYYDGTVNRMPCTVREKVFPNINFEQRYKVFAAINSAFNEVLWFYPSVAVDNEGNKNTECDSYVAYNYAEKCWYYGSLRRTAWVDRGFGSNPLGASDDLYVYYHEVGADDGSTNPPSPITSYITSSPLEIEDGQNFGFINRIIPDVSFRQTGDEPVYTSPDPKVTFTLYPQNYPGGMPPLDSNGVPENYYGTGDANNVNYSKTSTSHPIGTFTQQVFTRIRGRSVILRVGSDGLGVQWRLGTPRLDIRTDGRR